MKKNKNLVNSKIKKFISNFLSVIRKPEMVILPGTLAFFFVLAIIPVLGLISYGASILNLSTSTLYEFISWSFSKDMADLILGINLTEVAGVKFFTTIIVGLYVASNGADAIILTSNTIYGIKNRAWLKRRIKAIMLTFLLIILLIFMLMVPLFGELIMEFIRSLNMAEIIISKIEVIYLILKGPIAWLIMFLIIKIIYVLSPDKYYKNKTSNYGAIFTTIGFIVVTKIFSIYATNYADYTVLYGGLASLVVLMVWIYFLSYIFTIGIALNYKVDEDKLSKLTNIKNN